MKPTFNHTICETCWFANGPARFPHQIARLSGDIDVDHCCFCGSMKVTRIWVRHDPKDIDRLQHCEGTHLDDD